MQELTNYVCIVDPDRWHFSMDTTFCNKRNGVSASTSTLMVNNYTKLVIDSEIVNKHEEKLPSEKLELPASTRVMDRIVKGVMARKIHVKYISSDAHTSVAPMIKMKLEELNKEIGKSVETFNLIMITSTAAMRTLCQLCFEISVMHINIIISN